MFILKSREALSCIMFNARNAPPAALLLILITTLFVYWPVSNFAFINLDDPYLVQNNVDLLKPFSFAALVKPLAGLIHPLTTFTFWVDAQVSPELNAGQFHLTNIFFHLISITALFALAFRLTKSTLAAFLLAAFFAWHHANVESVAWISERKDVVSACFFWLCLLAAQSAKKKASLFLVFALGALSLLAKPFALGLPVFIAGLWALESRKLGKQEWFTLAALAGLVILAGSAAMFTQGELRRPDDFSLGSVAINLPLQLFFYLGRPLVPFYTSLNYSRADISYYFIPALLYAAIAAAIYGKIPASRRNFHYGWGFFFLCLTPMLKIVPFGDDSLVNDRYLYVASVGLFWPFALLVLPRQPQRSRLGIRYSAAASCLYLGILLLALPGFLAPWENSETYWSRQLHFYPNSKVANENLGRFYMESELAGKALSFLEKGRLDSAENIRTRAFALVRLGRLNEAEPLVNQAASLLSGDAKILSLQGTLAIEKKDYPAARKYLFASLKAPTPLLESLVRAEAKSNLGLIALREDNFLECVRYQSEALESLPHYAYALYNRGLCYLNMNQLHLARIDLERTAAENPKLALAQNGLGVVAVKENNLASARAYFAQALNLDPDLQLARKNLEAVSP